MEVDNSQGLWLASLADAPFRSGRPVSSHPGSFRTHPYHDTCGHDDTV